MAGGYRIGRAGRLTGRKKIRRVIRSGTKVYRPQLGVTALGAGGPTLAAFAVGGAVGGAVRRNRVRRRLRAALAAASPPEGLWLVIQGREGVAEMEFSELIEVLRQAIDEVGLEP